MPDLYNRHIDIEISGTDRKVVERLFTELNRAIHKHTSRWLDIKGKMPLPTGIMTNTYLTHGVMTAHRVVWKDAAVIKPAPRTTVLVALEGGEVHTGYRDGGKWKLEDEARFILRPVTHWAPLPEPPRSMKP